MKHLPIILLSFSMLLFVACANEEKQKAEQNQIIYNQMLDSLRSSIDTLTWHNVYTYQGKGNKTIDSVNINGPYRLEYVFQGSGNSSFTVNREENGELTAPLLVLTSAKSDCTTKKDSLKNATLKIINNSGRWSLSFSSLNYKTPLIKDSINESIYRRLCAAQDSLINLRIQALDTIQQSSIESMKNDLLEWNFLANSDYIWQSNPVFNIPSTSLRFQIALDIPEEKRYFDYMKNGVNGLDIEMINVNTGKTIKVLNHRGRCGYFTYNKEISVPAGKYKIEYEGLGDIAFNVYILQ